MFVKNLEMKNNENDSDVTASDKERFLTACGKFAAITPPEIIMLCPRH